MTIRDDDMVPDEKVVRRMDDDTAPEGHATPGGAAAAPPEGLPRLARIYQHWQVSRFPV